MNEKSHNLKFDNIRNLIFDLDGTLIDSSRGVIEATNYALSMMGEPVRKPEEIKRFIGYPLETMFGAFSRKSYDEFWKYFQEKARATVIGQSVQLDGSDIALRELHKRGYRLGIGTTKIRIHIEKIIAKFGWESLIAGYAGADDVMRVKPDPEVFIKVLGLMEADRAETLVVGDTENDVLAARAAGLRVIGVRSTFGSSEALEKSAPDLLVNSLQELLEILQ
jgi:HAD superfamily hydrolase (TIGR01549 family)